MNTNNLNNGQLKKDFNSGEIKKSDYFKFKGYVGNRPSDFEGEFHEDDTWVIDCYNEEDDVVAHYLYVSELEYDEDVKQIKSLNRKPKQHIYDRVENAGLRFDRSYSSPKEYGELIAESQSVGIVIYDTFFEVHDSSFKITPEILDMIKDLQDYVGKENVGKFKTFR